MPWNGRVFNIFKEHLSLAVLVTAPNLFVYSEDHEAKTCQNQNYGKKFGDIDQKPLGIYSFRDSAASDALAAENHLHEFGEDPHDMAVNIKDTLLRGVMALFVVKLDKLDFYLFLLLGYSQALRLVLPLFYLLDIDFVAE